MKYQLLTNPYTESGETIDHILKNRGIEDVNRYLHTTDNDINSFFLLGVEDLRDAAIALVSAIRRDTKTIVVVDCDCDGYTSAAFLLNYLHTLFPYWIENYVDYYLHDSKQHGLNDCIDYILDKEYGLVITPDSSSNDGEYHKRLKDIGADIIVLDHHIVDEKSSFAHIVNNQLCAYPNKDLSGVGIVYQFCRYIDSLYGIDNAESFLDLVALGLNGDMMSLQSIETKHLINKGFKSENISNPFIYNMWQRNKFKLGDNITPMGSAFYIVPFVNAMTRSGSLTEKTLLFESMLQYKAFEEVETDKRGHKGELVSKAEEAVLIANRVKVRQTKAQDAGMELIESLIEENNMLEHKVLLFLLEPGQIDRNIAGLIANKIMAKYQRPTCILTKVENEDGISYQGSSRGYSKSGVKSFKKICEQTGVIEYASGHENAFGLGIKIENIDLFIAETDYLLRDISEEPIYYVDYIYNQYNIDNNQILEIASLEPIWGQNVDESLIAIEKLPINPSMVTVYRKSSNTLKIHLDTGVDIMLFNASDELCETLETTNKTMTIIGKCNANEWGGRVTPQIFIEDWEFQRDAIPYF